MMDYYQNQGQKQVQKQSKQVKTLNTNVVLYLGELPPDIDQYELHQFIMSQGKFNVESLVVKPTKENKAYAYVKFKSKSEMEKARKALHLKTLNDYVIKAEPFRPKDALKKGENVEGKESGQNQTNLFIKNLPSTTTPKELYDLFSKYGNIISIKLKQNKKGECLGYGYVNYESEKSAEEALNNLNDKDFNGKNLYVSIFESKKERKSEEKEKFPLILVKQIPESLKSEKKLEELFSRYGQISFCGMVSGGVSKEAEERGNNPNSDNINITSESKVGVVLFVRKEDAAAAVDALNTKVLDDSHTEILLSLAPINKETIEKLWKAKQESYKNKYEGCNLVVKNLPKEVTERNLFEICKQFGDVAGARIATEGKMKEVRNAEGMVLDKEFLYESKGYGFVLFRNPEDAKAAKEGLNNQKIKFKDMTLSLVVEYYDYSKGEKAKMRGPKPVNKIPYSQNFNKPYRKQNFNSRGRGGAHTGNRGAETGENVVINNRTVINPKNAKGNMNQMHPHMIPQQGNTMNQANPFANPNMFMQMGNQMIPNNQNNVNNQLNPQINQINSQMSQINPFGFGMKPTQDTEFINNVLRILKNPNNEEKTEQLGETIFYYLINFIAKYNLNTSEGRFDDPTLCSKLTGMFLSIDEKDLLEILSNNEILIITIKDVVNVSLND